MIGAQFNRLRSAYHEFPPQFWTLMGASFIDSLGGALLFPFFTLYVTAKFGVGMAQVGLIFGMFSVASVLGSTMGGALSDRFGRKWMAIFGLVVSAGTSLFMGLVGRIEYFVVAAGVVGLFANAGGPARQAMIADLLSEEKQAEGFGVFRVVHNLAVTIGPAIGGLLAAQSYLLLFVLDAVTSLVTAAVFHLKMEETKPEVEPGAPTESTLESFRGYGKVVRDGLFMIFVVAMGLMVLVYTQMNGTLAVFLRDVHAVSEQGFGYILSLNAAMVVLFQFTITRRIQNVPSFLVMAAGTFLIAIGFAMYGFFAAYGLFLLAMVIITLGEMLTAPVAQSIAARMAPAAMRGRYMAVFGFSWVLPSALGIFLAGLIMDNYDPRWVWYAAGLVGLIPVLGFMLLNRREALRSEPESGGPQGSEVSSEIARAS